MCGDSPPSLFLHLMPYSEESPKYCPASLHLIGHCHGNEGRGQRAHGNDPMSTTTRCWFMIEERLRNCPPRLLHGILIALLQPRESIGLWDDPIWETSVLKISIASSETSLILYNFTKNILYCFPNCIYRKTCHTPFEWSLSVCDSSAW